MKSLIKNKYLLKNLETKEKKPVNKIVGSKKTTEVENKLGGYGEGNYQRGKLVESEESLANPKAGIYSKDSPLGKYLLKNDHFLKRGDIFYLSVRKDKKTGFEILERVKLID